MAIPVENKIDGDNTSKGKHFAAEVNTIVNTLNEPIEALGSQDGNSDYKQLAAALSAMQIDSVYKGTLDTSDTINQLKLTSALSKYLKTYLPDTTFSFNVDVVNTGRVFIRIEELSSFELKFDGNPLTGGELKPGKNYVCSSSGSVLSSYVDISELIGDNSSFFTYVRDLDENESLDGILGRGLYSQPIAPSHVSYPVQLEGSLTVLTVGDYVIQVYRDVEGNSNTRVYDNVEWGEWEATGTGSGCAEVKLERYIATDSQTEFPVGFPLYKPAVFIGGSLQDDSYEIVNGDLISFHDGLPEDSVVRVYSVMPVSPGNGCDMSMRTYREVATDSQTEFQIGFIIDKPAVYVGGSLQDGNYDIINGKIIRFHDGLSEGEVVRVYELVITTETANGPREIFHTVEEEDGDDVRLDIEYIVGSIQVFKEGIKLIPDDEFSATTGTYIDIFDTDVNEKIQIVIYDGN